MSLDTPCLQGDLVFMDQPDANSVFPDEKCIDPSLVNRFPEDSSTSSGFPSPEFASEGMPFNSPPPSISSESDDAGRSYDVDGLMSPISRRASIDWPLPEPRASKTKRASTRVARRRSSASAGKHKPAGRRVPHNIVEQKYRNTLNAEMERLRGAIPHMARLGDESGGSNTKPSKANILAAAVAYIRSLEVECDRLERKNVELQQASNVSFRRGRLP
jgi:hypothetical protein